MTASSTSTALGAEQLLGEAVARLGERPPSADRLDEPAGWLRQAVAAAELPADPAGPGRRIVLEHEAGPILVIADFPAGGRTDIHSHGTWGVGVVLAGGGRYERWEPVGEATARLSELRERSEGATFSFGPPPLDVNVPEWRFQLTGRAAIEEALAEELDVAGRRCTRLRRVDTDDRVLVETEVRFSTENGERLWRDQHHFRLADGVVVEHVVYCTGCWDPDTISRQAAEAPMVRP